VRSLYVRIWLTVVAALALFAAVSGWMLRQHLEAERVRIEASVQTRAEAWADLLQRSLPPADAPHTEQAEGLRDWSQRLRLPLALDDSSGRRIGASESYLRREAEVDGGMSPRRVIQLTLADGRILSMARPRRVPGGEARGDGMRGGPADLRGGPGGPGRGERGEHDRLRPDFMATIPGLPEGTGIVVLLALLFLAVAGGAYPFVRRLTRRLESLKQGVEIFGAGALHHRVDASGRDEVAAVATSFNQAATRIETLMRTNQSLLANASHELRSPLARLKMAVAMLDDAAPAQRENLRREIHANIGELDALVEEVLLASRLDAARDELVREPVDLLALAAEEAARVGAGAEGDSTTVQGDERLIRRALRNLLENAHRYGGGELLVQVQRAKDGGAEVHVCDRGPGVPTELRERIFEAFFRLPGHAERAGGVGLGLSLVRQIAQRHGGSVRCEPRDGGGSCFTLALPPK
jgi:signal transduction histidine kinase